MILHTINKTSALARCESLIGQDDVVVLLEDGVYLATSPLPYTCFALTVDVDARGLRTHVDKRITLINHVRFVQLCTEADKVCAWF